MKYSIDDLIKGGWNPIPVRVDNTEIIDTNTLKFVFRRFGERVYIYSADEIAAAVDDIGTTWEIFVSTHNNVISKMFNAFNTEYKPLENYSMVENGNDKNTIQNSSTGTLTANNTDTVQKTGTVTTETNSTEKNVDTKTTETKNTGTVTTDSNTTGKNVDTTTIETKNTGTQTAAGSGDTSNSVAAFNDTDVSLHDKQTTTNNSTRTDDLTESVTNGGEINTTAVGTATVTNDTTEMITNGGEINTTVGGTSTITNDITDTNSISKSESTTTTENGSNTNEHTLTRSGNIGVTTSQQMLSSEIFLRVRNQISYYAVELFISQFTVWE